MKYTIVLEKGESSFGAFVPDLPGCIAAGEHQQLVFAEREVIGTLEARQRRIALDEFRRGGQLDLAAVADPLTEVGHGGEVVFVGDSENDVAAAKAAGMAVVVLRGGYTSIAADDLGADAVVDRLDGLGAAVSTLRSAPA